FIFVGEVNSELPFMEHEAEIAPGQLDFILDSEATDFPLFAPPKEPVNLTDYAIGLQAARLVADDGTLQIGIGSMGDAVAHGLILRQQGNGAFREAAERLSP